MTEERARTLGKLAAFVMRLLLPTLRVRFVDHAGVLAAPPGHPFLWAFWHNRLFIIPWLFQTHLRDRRGAALASPSRDGEIIAAALECFGIRPIRGSSSRGGGRALVEMKRVLAEGYTVGITPDGPRGPRYSLNPGLVKLAQISGVGILPVRIRYSRYWQLGSWDRFRVPQPFARVEIIFLPLEPIAPDLEGEAFDAECRRIERLLHDPDDE